VSRVTERRVNDGQDWIDAHELEPLLEEGG